jgi:hypothetical protein
MAKFWRVPEPCARGWIGCAYHVLTKDKLLAAAADANARNGSQMSAHQIASMFERTEILELLETYAREPSAGGSG